MKNGLIYKNGCLSSLFEKVKWLLDNSEMGKELGANAYQTIVSDWNAENASERLCSIIENFYNGDMKFYSDGVASRSDVIKENWYR